MTRVVPALLLLAGCSSAFSPPRLADDETERGEAGRRLTPVRWVVEDGAELPLSARAFRDAELDSRCWLQPLTASGTPVCMPGNWTGDFVAFADSSCETLITPRPQCGPQDWLVPRYEVGAIGVVEVAAFRTTDVELDGGASYGGDGWGFPYHGACTERDAPPAYSGIMPPYGLAERIPEEAMVPVVAEEREDLGGGLTDVTQLFEDGSVTRSREMAEPCEVWPVDGAWRCLPPHISYSPGQFADAGCREPIRPAARVETPVGTELVFIGEPPEVRAVVERVESLASTYWRDEDGRCVERRAPPNGPYERLGPPIPLDRFPALTRRFVGRGRLSALRWLDDAGRAWPVRAADAGSQGLRTPVPHLRDEQLGIDCSLHYTVEGVSRCLPVGTIAGMGLRNDNLELPIDEHTIYADPTCTTPVLVRFVVPPTLEPTHLAFSGSRGEGCDRVHGVVGLRELAEPLSGATTVYHVDAGVCVEGPRVQPAEWTRYYRLGDVVDLETFASANLVP